MPFNRHFPFAAGLLAAVCLVAGCNGGNSTTGPGNPNEIVIGHFTSLTGTEADFGKFTDYGIQLAVEEINAAGGINGKTVRVITEDDRSNTAEAGTVVTRLITNSHVVAVLGEVASGRSMAGGPVCQEYGIPMISPSSTNPEVTRVGDMIFRVCFIDPFQGYVCAKFAREHEALQASRAAILHDQANPYSVGLAEEFEKAFTSMGGVITTRQEYTKGDNDFSAQLNAVRAGNPEVIFVPGFYAEVSNVAIQARGLGITVPLLGGDGWSSPNLPANAGDAIDGSYFSDHYSPEDPSQRVQGFITKFTDKFGEPPNGLAALGYDAAKLLCDAIGRAESLSGEDIRDAIAATRDFDGVTGIITINAERNAVKPAVILQFVDGTPTYVTTISPDE